MLIQEFKSILGEAEIALAHRGIETELANWKPLKRRIGQRCGEFMRMFRQNGLEYYKHIDTRRYLILDRKGKCYRRKGDQLVRTRFPEELRFITRAIEMSMERLSTVGAGCAFLLAVAYGITTRRGVVLMVAGIILLWLPALRRTFTAEMATEKTRIEQHESSRAERRAGGS